MARSARIPRDDPALQDFDDRLARYTLKTPPPPVGCGRSYVRFSHLHKWFLSPPDGDDANKNSTQARRLLDYAYRDWSEHRHSNLMPTNKLFDAPDAPPTGCIKIFSILLMMDWGCLVHLFRSQHKFDHNLPIDLHDLEMIFRTMLSRLSGRKIYFDPKLLAYDFDELQWQFCPAKFEFDEERLFSQKLIIPIVKKSMISNNGGTAVLWQIEVLQEFVTDELAAAVPNSIYDEPQDGLGPRFNFALKTFNEGYKQAYDRELEAFRSVPPEGMIQYLGAYAHGVIQHAEAYHSPTNSNILVEETHNILLEFGECDLGTVFNEEPLPLVSQTDIEGFWRNLFEVAKTLGQIHHVTRDTDGIKKEFWGWHADIKPSNILEIYGKFKLADPGFAKFQEKVAGDNTESIASLDGGTSTYSAPEQVPRRGASQSKFHQTVDVWALGCVFSEAATWVTLGSSGVQRYAQLREQGNARAINKAKLEQAHGAPRLEEGDYFHDGNSVLPEVTGWHAYLRTIVRGSDHVTSYVLDVVEKSMFISNPLERSHANDIYDQLLKIRIGLDDWMSTVPKEVNDFLSSPAEAMLPPQNLASVELTSNPNAGVSYGRRDQKSKYISRVVTKPGQTSNVKPSRVSNVYDNDSVTPERPRKITNGPLYHSPTQSANFNPNDIYGEPKIYLDQQILEMQARKSQGPEQTLFRGKVEDIFQANEAISERSTMSRLKSLGKKPVDDDLVRHYQNRDIKFLVDNSWFMWKHWAHVKFVLKTLVMKAKGIDPDGVDLYFTSGGVKAEKKTGVKPLMEAMAHPNALPPKSDTGQSTNMAISLKELFNEYIRMTKSRMQHNQQVTNLTIIVLTDGMWEEGPVIKRIVEFVTDLKNLTKKDIDDRPVSIEFIQFGRHPYATEKLELLDNQLKYTQSIPDLVDTEHADGNVYKMLLGSFVPEFDDSRVEHDDDRATIRPESSATQSYFNNRQSTMNTDYSHSNVHQGHYATPPGSQGPYISPPSSQGSVGGVSPDRRSTNLTHRGSQRGPSNGGRTYRY